ncbi:hypothetical protein Bca4012_007114 [Brassica carinata]
MKSKFVVTPPANVTETVLSKNPKLCSKKEIPVQYGGNERDDDTKLSNEADSPTKLFLKLSYKNKVKPIQEQGETKASEDDTHQSSKVFVKLITSAK